MNGACVTVTGRFEDTFACDLVPETLARTNLGTLQPGELVNLERPLHAASRLDGHIVQGHIDVVGTIRSRRRVGAQEMLEVTVPFELTRYLAPKGSVSVDGVSLTLVDVNKDRFRVALIPHTLETTTLGRKLQGDAVNVEVDVISKYVERHLAARQPFREPSLAELVGPPPPRPEPLAAVARMAVPAAASRRPRPRATDGPEAGGETRRAGVEEHGETDIETHPEAEAEAEAGEGSASAERRGETLDPPVGSPPHPGEEALSSCSPPSKQP